ncbi:MAG: VanZ family protein [Spirosomaceae bacterium]|nr:VanZ family protein [Spirosomataceae bacterium]
MIKKLLLFAAISYTFLLFTLTSMPSENIPDNDINDKTAHFVAFAGFSIAWLLIKADYVKVIIAGIAFGVFIEFWQGILPESFHRSYEVLDMLADGIGTLIGCCTFWVAKRLSTT